MFVGSFNLRQPLFKKRVCMATLQYELGLMEGLWKWTYATLSMLGGSLNVFSMRLWLLRICSRSPHARLSLHGVPLLFVASDWSRGSRLSVLEEDAEPVFVWFPMNAGSDPWKRRQYLNVIIVLVFCMRLCFSRVCSRSPHARLPLPGVPLPFVASDWS